MKIFLDSLQEDSTAAQDKVKIETVARGITNCLVGQFDPSKKEFREKVNMLKMKLKGSRNAPAR